MHAPLPAVETLCHMLGTLLDRRVTLTRATARLKITPGARVALYADAEGHPHFACIADVGFLAAAGAALALIPASVAAEAIRRGVATDALIENAYEVLNIAAASFNETGATVHVRLDSLLPMSEASTATASAISHATRRLDLDVRIPTYGDGKLAIVALAP